MLLSFCFYLCHSYSQSLKSSFFVNYIILTFTNAVYYDGIYNPSIANKLLCVRLFWGSELGVIFQCPVKGTGHRRGDGLGKLRTRRMVGVTLQEVTGLVEARLRPLCWKQAAEVRALSRSYTAQRPQDYRTGSDRSFYWSGLTPIVSQIIIIMNNTLPLKSYSICNCQVAKAYSASKMCCFCSV